MVITKESTALHDQFTKQIRVLCVDDHRLVRQGIALIIDRTVRQQGIASLKRVRA